MNPLDIFGDATASRAQYALRAWLVAVLPSIVYFFARVTFVSASLRPPARALDVTSAAYSILAAPLLETALMFAVLSLLSLMIPRRPRVQIVLLAAIGALAHRIGGDWQQVLASLWPYLVYSVTLTTWLRHSRSAAFVLTALVHALYNATFFVVGALGVLVAGPG